MDTPIYPQGSPEYEAYAAALRVELDKFAKGEEPYSYRRDEVAMPTVPNWIGHSVVIRNYNAYAVRSWRALKTQVVVTLDVPNHAEVRFYLDGLVGVGGDRGAQLLDATDPITIGRVAMLRSKSAIRELETVMALARFDRIRSDPEALAVEIGSIRDAATAALASLAEVL